MDVYENEGELSHPGWLCFFLACWRIEILLFLWWPENKLQLQLAL
jgi:hypothetical protein